MTHYPRRCLHFGCGEPLSGSLDNAAPEAATAVDTAANDAGNDAGGAAPASPVSPFTTGAARDDDKEERDK